MSAIVFSNAVASSIATTAEFRLFSGVHQIARVGVHAGGSAIVPTVVDEDNDGQVNTMQEWTAYAIVNGITTPTVTVANPNARLTLSADNAGGGFTLTVQG
jgi:hypothetical protein